MRRSNFFTTTDTATPRAWTQEGYFKFATLAQVNPLDVAFGFGFERLYHALNRKKTCSRQLAQDPFDGHLHTIESFNEMVAPFFESPRGFYDVEGSLEDYDLREGVHPREGALTDVPMRRLLFRTPRETEWPENNLVPLKCFEEGESDTFLLFVPGWGRSSQRFEELMCRRWASQGIHAGLITKPYHQARAPEGSFTGEYFISANLFWTIANFRQCVSEILLVLKHMRARYRRIGLFGMSSGGFQAGLAATCVDVDFLFPYITGCQLGSITWHGLITQYVRRDLERKGIDEATLNRAWRITDLAVIGHHTRAQHIKQYIAKYDSVIHTRYQRQLWRVYHEPAKVDLESSHYSSFFRRDFIVDDVAKFIRERG